MLTQLMSVAMQHTTSLACARLTFGTAPVLDTDTAEAAMTSLTCACLTLSPVPVRSTDAAEAAMTSLTCARLTPVAGPVLGTDAAEAAIAVLTRALVCAHSCLSDALINIWRKNTTNKKL